MKSRRDRRRSRKSYRKQCGGSLADQLAEKAEVIQNFLHFMDAEDRYVSAHPNFPRKNPENKFVMIYKDAEFEEDATPQKLLVIKMEKQGPEFVNISVEYLQDAIPQSYIDAYPMQLEGGNADSISLSNALESAFPGRGLRY